MPRHGSVRCVSCGYELATSPGVEALSRCPECGEESAGHRLRAWPSPGLIAWQVVRWQAGWSLATFLVWWGAVRANGAERPLAATVLTMLLVVTAITTALLLLFIPVHVASVLTQAHCPRNRRVLPFAALLGLGWLASVLVLIALLILASAVLSR